MKKKFTSPMLTPKYVTEFHCIGSDCPDTCCRGWTIFVDKESFQDYRRVTHPVLKPLFKSHLIQFDKNSDVNFGRFSMPASDAHCGLESDDGLCSIQKNLGEDALSDTCYAYPRSIRKVGDQFEQSLSLTCPEAARLALTVENAFEFVTTAFTSRESTTAQLLPMHGFDLPVIEEIRVLCIQLFQTAELANTDRLVLLGWLCSQLDELIASNAQAQAMGVLKQLIELVESGAFHSAVEKLSNDPKIAANVFSILFNSATAQGGTPHQKEVLTWVNTGLMGGAESATATTVLEENYLRGLAHLERNSAQLDQILSRYLMNDLLIEAFPWGHLSPMVLYRRLLTRFGILRLMLAATANAKEGPLDQATLVQVTQVFCRMYQHNEAFATRADQLLTGADWGKLDQLYSLL